jgi:hypothetical protein
MAMAWKRMGSLQELERLAADEYPLDRYEYGVKLHPADAA